MPASMLKPACKDGYVPNVARFLPRRGAAKGNPLIGADIRRTPVPKDSITLDLGARPQRDPPLRQRLRQTPRAQEARAA